MVHQLPVSEVCTQQILSLDAHVARVAATGKLMVYRVASDSVHPRVFPGDILLVENFGRNADLYHEKHMLLFCYDGKFVMRQKAFIDADLKRSAIRLVGDKGKRGHTIQILGRLIGWLSGGHLCLTLLGGGVMKTLTSLLMIALLFAAPAFSQSKKKKPKPPPVNYLLRGSVAVDTRLHSIPFIIGQSGGVVTGRFEARGGSQNDIFCYIVDPDGFQNLSNRNEAKTFYNSGRVTVANLTVHLYPGKYYLVFHNDALFASKTIYGNIRYSGAGD